MSTGVGKHSDNPNPSQQRGQCWDSGAIPALARLTLDLCHAVPCHAEPYCAMLRHAAPCHAVPCCAMPCCAAHPMSAPAGLCQQGQRDCCVLWVQHPSVPPGPESFGSLPGQRAALQGCSNPPQTLQIYFMSFSDDDGDYKCQRVSPQSPALL